MRSQLRDLLNDALFTGAAALAVAVFVAGVLSQLLLRPIHVLRSGLTRLGQGEFGVTLDLPAGDEFGELGDFFNTVSQQLSADRTLLAGQKANLQSAVEHLEDAVALFNPSGELLFSNPAMQHTLPADAIGRVLDGLLPTGHPYRTLVEETLATRKSRGPIQIQGHSTEQVQAPARSGDTGPILRAAGPHPIVTKPEAKPGDDELVVTHAIAGTRGELVGVLAGVAEPRASLAHAIDARVFTQARGIGPSDGRHRARGEEPVERDDDSPRAAANEDSRQRCRRASTRTGGCGRWDARPWARACDRASGLQSRERSSTSKSSRAKSVGWMRSSRDS